MTTAHLTKLANPMNVWTHAPSLSVEVGQGVRLRGTRAFALVLQDCKAMPTCLAQKSDVSQMMSVPSTKSVTSNPENVSSFAPNLPVHKVPDVKQIIIGRPAHATTPCKATDTHPVYHVSPQRKKIGIYF